MKELNFSKVLILSIFLFNLMPLCISFASEPIVVLEYSSQSSQNNGLNSSNTFISNPNFSSKHRVKENETLGHILYSYYGKSFKDPHILNMKWQRCF